MHVFLFQEMLAWEPRIFIAFQGAGVKRMFFKLILFGFQNKNLYYIIDIRMYIYYINISLYIHTCLCMYICGAFAPLHETTFHEHVCLPKGLKLFGSLMVSTFFL